MIIEGHFQLRCLKCGYVGTLAVDFPDESLKKMKEMEKVERLDKKMRKLERKFRY